MAAEGEHHRRLLVILVSLMSNLDPEATLLLLMRRINAVEDVLHALIGAMANTRAGDARPHEGGRRGDPLPPRHGRRSSARPTRYCARGAASETQRRTRAILSRAGGDPNGTRSAAGAGGASGARYRVGAYRPGIRHGPVLQPLADETYLEPPEIPPLLSGQNEVSRARPLPQPHRTPVARSRTRARLRSVGPSGLLCTSRPVVSDR